MYQISNLTGNIYKNGAPIPLDDNSIEYQKFKEDLANGVEVLYIENTIEEITELEIKKSMENEFQFYLKRKSDGENAYLKLRAEFRLAKLSGQISEETHSYLEELLTPVRNEVMFGQWKKGLEILENIGAVKVGAELYNRLHSQITEYISNNY